MKKKQGETTIDEIYRGLSYQVVVELFVKASARTLSL